MLSFRTDDEYKLVILTSENSQVNSAALVFLLVICQIPKERLVIIYFPVQAPQKVKSRLQANISV